MTFNCQSAIIRNFWVGYKHPAFTTLLRTALNGSKFIHHSFCINNLLIYREMG